MCGPRRSNVYRSRRGANRSRSSRPTRGSGVFGGDAETVGRPCHQRTPLHHCRRRARAGLQGPDRFEPTDLWIPLGVHATRFPGEREMLSTRELVAHRHRPPGRRGERCGRGSVLGGVGRALAESHSDVTKGFHMQGRLLSGRRRAEPRGSHADRGARARGHRVCSAHRLRERSGVAAVQQRAAPARDRHPAGDRCHAWRAGEPIHGRKPRALSSRATRRTARRDVGHGDHRALRRDSRDARLDAGLACRPLHIGRLAGCRPWPSV